MRIHIHIEKEEIPNLKSALDLRNPEKIPEYRTFTNNRFMNHKIAVVSISIDEYYWLEDNI